MKVFTVEEARRRIEQIRVIARSAENRAKESKQRATETDDPGMKSFWKGQAEEALRCAEAIDAECDHILRSLPN